LAHYEPTNCGQLKVIFLWEPTETFNTCSICHVVNWMFLFCRVARQMSGMRVQYWHCCHALHFVPVTMCYQLWCGCCTYIIYTDIPLCLSVSLVRCRGVSSYCMCSWLYVEKM